MSTEAPLQVTAVVLAWQDAPWLRACVERLLDSVDVELTIVLVDNGCTNPALPQLAGLARVRLLEPGTNLGYAGGCNAGAAGTADPLLAFVNSDCLVEPATLQRLALQALDAGVGLATAGVKLAGQPTTMNSAGNPVHFTGLSWAGAFGEADHLHSESRDVASVSGACFMVRRAVWDELGGYPDFYFAYHEDVELSLRCWLAGLKVRYVADAVCYHHYEFSRHPQKHYLLERNRLLTLMTVLSRRTLLLLLPALVAVELAMLVLAARQGWARQKVAGWLWILRHPSLVRARRSRNAERRRAPDHVLVHRLTGRLTPGRGLLPTGAALVDVPLSTYWWLLRRWIT